jgi:hypothetical protein
MKYLLSIIGSLALLSCSDQNPTPEHQESPVAILATENFDLALFTPHGKFETGYNTLTVHVKDKNGNFIDLPDVEVSTLMHMQHMQHGGPASPLRRKELGIYEGHLIFQMPSNEQEHWELIFNGIHRIVIDVLPTKQVRTQSFLGSDGLRYVLAMQDIEKPKVGSNVLSAYLYRMQDARTFLPLEGYTIRLDPRMPGMGNHSSPNNRDLTSKGEGYYEGLVNLTMTGYWKLNLILEKDTRIKGEEEDSSIYFEIEF